MNETGGAGFKKRGSQRISGFLSAACAAVTVIPLDVRLPARSSHLPASSVGHVIACLFGVAPGGGCRVSPRRYECQQAGTHGDGLVSVALFLASRRTVVSRHPTLRSPDFPLFGRRTSEQRLPGQLPREF